MAQKSQHTNQNQITAQLTQQYRQQLAPVQHELDTALVDQTARAKKHHKWFITSLACGTLVIAGALGGYYAEPDHNPLIKLSKSEQNSLINSETVAVEHNGKPADVINGLAPRIHKLTGNDRYQAVELMYTSVQNASLYYNNAATMMSGEIEYSRPNNSFNSLAAARHNSWLGGFIADVRQQSLVPYNLNRNQILMLPNFDELCKYKNEASPDLRELLLAGKEAQDCKVFTNDEINQYNAAKAYNDIVKRYPRLLNANRNSKYRNDINSLMRIYHDLALGYMPENNYQLTKSGGQYYQISPQGYRQLEKIANNPRFFLANEARQELKAMNQHHAVKASWMEAQQSKSLSTFGTSVYYQGKDDIQNITKQLQAANNTHSTKK